MGKNESKSYQPAEHERRIFEKWQQGPPGQQRSYFHPSPDGRPPASPDERPPERRFSMVIPPPNVTGALHLGHALNNTLQDILVRRRRMMGDNTFWLVGTDHAGIATQATVEKHIKKTEGLSRYDLGPTPDASREELVRRIWQWKEQYGGRIVEQLKRMGCSCDYERERFTLDDKPNGGCIRAVRETFFKMFRDGLIYRGKRLVNWDTQLQTAVADDEVYHEEVRGHFYHLRYPIVAQATSPVAREPTHVHIATTRPETMLADTAVAVHPEPDAALEVAETQLQVKLREASEKERPAIEQALADIAERKTNLLPALLKLRDMAKAGRRVMLPLVDREIPLICDEWADPTLGTGCVKITPAHDFNDYEVGLRHELAMVNMMKADGHVNENGGPSKGLKLADARKKVVADLEALGLVEKIEDRLIDLAHSDRSNTPIEPYLSDQWFVKMDDLTKDEAARIQTPFLRDYIERARTEPRPGTEPRPSGSGFCSDAKNPLADARGSEENPLPDGRGSDRLLPGLAQMAIDAVKRGEFRFHPARYEKTYLDWLGEKRDWCISRQLWWGHRIPVWTALIKHFVGPPGHTVGIGDELLDSDVDDIRLRLTTERHEIIRPLLPGVLSEWQICFRFEPNAQESTVLDDKLVRQDPDVLDTWFSSALWPHSTMGWPGDLETEPRPGFSEPRPSGSGFCSDAKHPADGARGSEENPLPDGRGSDQADGRPVLPGSLLNYYYPTKVLSTAREIITLWVARMVITGLYNVGEVPFRDVVIHPVIQDGQGRKMSKSLGNGVDPVDIIEEYGADALRFTLAELATETQDIRLPVKPKKLPDGRTINVSEKFEKGRNFCNKLWQAATGFVIPNLSGYAPRALDPKKLSLVDRWILSRLTACIEETERAMERYRFSDTVGAAYRFMWDEYCSWYIEMTKSRLTGGDTGPQRAEAQQVLVYALDQLLRLLHPIVPFVTEAVWERLNEAAPQRGLTAVSQAEPMLVAAAWPTVDPGAPGLRDAEAERQMADIHDVIRGVRDIRTVVNGYRSQSNQPVVRTLPSVVVRADAAAAATLEKYRAMIQSLAGCDALEIGEQVTGPRGAMHRTAGRIDVYAPVADLIDLAEVRRAEERQVESLQGALNREKARLANEDFVQRAAPEVVEQARQRADDLSSRISAIRSHLAELE
jgi:valyl-tRNA synthetase